MEYLSIKQIAEKWNLSARRINVLCSEERIEGAIKIGHYWAIPANAEKPKDARIMRYLNKELQYSSTEKGEVPWQR